MKTHSASIGIQRSLTMIQKTFVEAQGKKVARITFTLPSRARSEAVHLVGDFNDWNTSSHPFQRNPEGQWVLTLELDLRRAYQFRYLRDGHEWMYDSQADAYVYNPHGPYNFVVVTDPGFKRYDVD